MIKTDSKKQGVIIASLLTILAAAASPLIFVVPAASPKLKDKTTHIGDPCQLDPKSPAC